MKKFILTFLVILFSFKTFSQNLKKVGKDSVDIDLLKIVNKSTYNIFSTYRKDEIPEFSKNIFSNHFLNDKSKDNITAYIKSVYEKFGLLSSYNVEQVLIDENSTLTFRIKVKFSKVDFYSEIRVKVNKTNKIDEIICKSFWYNKYYKVSENPLNALKEISSKNITKAKLFLEKTFKNCEKRNYLKLNNKIATNRLINSLTNKKIHDACLETKNRLGKLISYKLYEVLTDKKYQIIYRFKAIYEKEKTELRVYTTLQHKYSGIYIMKYWNDKFYAPSKLPKKEAK
ncbi:MAG: hypothetical protein ABJH82_05195 [Polaribacter sp.]|uniref:hypothetical protein n=1 Tax=Polaribacter sp. TaxID=1920175 RepID=UPI003267BE79